MDDLIATLEAATGPDRGLDVRIAVAVDWRWDDWEEGEPTVKRLTEKHSIEWMVQSTMGGMSIWRNLPWFTASLDAAMKLVPENADSAGERFRLEHWNTNGVHAPHVRASAWVAGAPRVQAATPALALAAAALRARQEPQP